MRAAEQGPDDQGPIAEKSGTGLDLWDLWFRVFVGFIEDFSDVMGFLYLGCLDVDEFRC